MSGEMTLLWSGFVFGVIATVAVFACILLFRGARETPAKKFDDTPHAYPGGAADLSTLMAAQDHFPPRKDV